MNGSWDMMRGKVRVQPVDGRKFRISINNPSKTKEKNRPTTKISANLTKNSSFPSILEEFVGTCSLYNLIVATTRRPSDSGAFADWVASSSSDKININDLSLGFNAGPANASAVPSAVPSMWPTTSRPLGYGLPPEMSMFVVAPATSFHHPIQHDPLISDSVTGPNATLGVGVIPLLTANPRINVCGGDEIGSRSRGGANQFSEGLQQQQQVTYPKKSINFAQNSIGLMTSGVVGGGAEAGTAPGGYGPVGGSGGTTTCQDCGNQAKKDCSHRRCRTCCRGRGFDCQTHVRSTWVPAARRRERQMAGASGTGGGASSGSNSWAKRPRLIASQNNTATTSNTSTSNTPPKSSDTSPIHQEASFKEALPGQVRAPAVFKCVRVTAVDDDGDEYAYQAAVKIGGHVFKGFLYDNGLEQGNGIPNISDLHLGGGGASGSGRGGGCGGGEGVGGGNGISSSSALLEPPEFYAASGGGLLGSASYGNTIN
ncbi:hypothetical protein Nepgr_014866 [Nepenthes gracilis]|uniref:Uncharacterized protein n=1 Tax=Nepenthes gracilis TaxID=150966 RepID=A0AAD3SK12_NEPGR|nr:hypothetical protein Nepgr_014866 [Nepenthes gracilis]